MGLVEVRIWDEEANGCLLKEKVEMTPETLARLRAEIAGEWTCEKCAHMGQSEIHCEVMKGYWRPCEDWIPRQERG